MIAKRYNWIEEKKLKCSQQKRNNNKFPLGLLVSSTLWNEMKCRKRKIDWNFSLIRWLNNLSNPFVVALTRKGTFQT